MKKKNPSENHHWFPKSLQQYWKASDNRLWHSRPDGSHKHVLVPKNRNKNGFTKDGHIIDHGAFGKTNFESDFDVVDNSIPQLMGALKTLKPKYTPTSFLFDLIKLKYFDIFNQKKLFKYHEIDETTHRSLLRLLLSLIIRSPASRNIYENYGASWGVPRCQDSGKINMKNSFKRALTLTDKSSINNQFFVLIYSPLNNFVFGDGIPQWGLENLIDCHVIYGRALVPLTPDMCIYFNSSYDNSRNKCRFATTLANNFMTNEINDSVQIFSKNRLYYSYEHQKPLLLDSFKEENFLTYRVSENQTITYLDNMFQNKPDRLER